jgi:hypothetical protein
MAISNEPDVLKKMALKLPNHGVRPDEQELCDISSNVEKSLERSFCETRSKNFSHLL